MSNKGEEQLLRHTEDFFVRHSSEYETSDNGQNRTMKLLPQLQSNKGLFIRHSSEYETLDVGPNKGTKIYTKMWI